MSGDGSKSDWYQKSIESTYTAFQHNNAGGPPYKLLEVPRPKDFVEPKGSGDEFFRFAIGYACRFLLAKVPT
ncbi:hypothetical protein CO731_04773 [Aminobacter sp. MSH1]|uniref:hypothetical protein n=1 Tax=Aminobacter sp. MSH1 TaxID=374606 RepID=UPI000D3D01A3|nr:hypothetical protein [Aminobacter sp. MSH1]AWC25278.1 hypothetical protein CO731_04773 [Aminobacter sp. MSH1]